MMLRAIALIALASGCGSAKNDLCSRAVTHVFELTTMGEVSAEERKVVDLAVGASLARCRSEGLSDAQASCILAARGVDWDEGLRACPAFAAKPPTWVIVRPSREERIRIFGGTLTPDGPRHGPVSYRSLVGTVKSTCGLDAAGAIQCWGQKVEVPTGTFTALRADDTMVCGLEIAGSRVRCASARDLALRLPTDPLTDFDIARQRGCGLRTVDGSIVCWNHLDDAGFTPPAGQFVDLALAGGTACALGLDERVTCFGDDALAAPPDVRFQSISVANGGICGITIAGTIACFGDGSKDLRPPPGSFRALDCRRAHCCGIKEDATLSCWGAPHEVYEPPAGTFTSVAVFVRHACAVRAAGGTICWGDNDWGACNVPQR